MTLEPKFKAQIVVDVDGESCPTLCDTGCQRSCISENLLRRHPTFYKNKIKPHKGKTISIDGSRVDTVGTINIQFRLKGRFMRVNCRIVKNLIYDLVLGWEFFSQHNCSIHPGEGFFTYENDRIPFTPSSLGVSSTHFSLAEDTVVPSLSKMITRATYYLDPHHMAATSDTVEVEPLYGNIAKVAVARGIAKVNDGAFPIELLNPFPHAVTIRMGEVLGHVSFTSDEALEPEVQCTNINLEYGAEDSGYESEGTASACECEEEVAATSGNKVTPATKTTTAKPEFDLNIAEDAEPFREQLESLLKVKHAGTFSTSERDRGKTDLVEFHANIKPGPPISVPPYRATPQMQEEANKIVHEMIADGLVSHSTSPYSAPVLLVPKKLGGWRFVTDFRKVNARCERVVYPLPRIEDALRQLKEPRYFSTMDLTKGFWQVPIAEADRKYFAFSTGTLHVEYNVMPMGALNASATMQALMTLILRGLPPEHIICFLDDILVASSTMEEHLVHLDQVLTAIARAGLKLNGKKCLFAQESVSCLGHLLSREGIGPDPRNLDKIKKWKPPKNRTEVRQFLGLTGYYRQLIKNYAEIASPLTDLTKSDADWRWTEKEQKAFVSLRDHLTSSSIMAYPNFERPFWVKSDASGSSVGYVLTQMYEKREKVIAYGSKKLTDTQRRYSTYDREFFGILTAVRAYSHYLRHAHFYVITDHRPLLSLKKIDPKADATGRRVRWSIELNLYDFEVIYKKGRKHSDADAMSRLTDHDDYAEEEEFAGFMLEGEDELYLLLGMDDGDAITAVELISDKDRRKDLALAQDKDPSIKLVKQLLREKKAPPRSLPAFYRSDFTKFVVQDNILYRKERSGPSNLPILQALIPPSLILGDAHGSIFAGHPGAQRMLDTLRRHVNWPTIAADCRKHVTKCKQCDRNSQPTPAVRTELQSINPSFVFEHVCCDLIQLPPVAGWKYVCVFMDVFSRHVTLYKMRDKSTMSFTRALEHYVAHAGCPQKLTCDNGAEFCSQLVDAVTKILGIKKRTSVVYRPQSQGMVERWNRQLVSELRARLLQSDTTWPEQMHYIAMAHNAAPSARTGESPNLVFFGRELPLPTFTDFATNTLREKSVQEYVKKCQERVNTIHEAVRTESVRRSEKTAEAYNRKVKHSPLSAGDLVYFKETPKNCLKTDPRWTGPVEVVKRHSNAVGQPGTTYTVKYKEGSTFRRNYEQLKLAKADFQGPISVEESPSAVPPRVHVPFAAASSSDEEPDPTTPTAPIASRTRSRLARAGVPAAATAAMPPAPTHPTEPQKAMRLPPPILRRSHTPRVTAVSRVESPQQTIAASAACQASFSPLEHSGDGGSGPSFEEEAAALTDISALSGINSLWWDTAGSLASDPPVRGHTLDVVNPVGRPPVDPRSRSPSSRGTTPDASHNTVVRRSPAQPTTPLPVAVSGAGAAGSPASGDPVLSATALGASRENSGDLEQFQEFLDTVTEELELFTGVGPKRIDVLLREGFEYRRDRATERTKLSQLWVCRYAGKFRCKGKFRLNVRDLDDFITGASISSPVEHNHAPHRVNTYGCASVTEVQTSNPSINTSPSPESYILESSRVSSLAISQEDLSADFGPNVQSGMISSPVGSANRGSATALEDQSQASEADLSWDLVGVSQEDVNPFHAISHVPRRSWNEERGSSSTQMISDMPLTGEPARPQSS